MKLVVAEVAVVGGAVRLSKVLFGEEHPVKFGLDLEASQTGELSAGIREQGLATLTRLVDAATSFGCRSAADIPGCATAVFRKAKNGPEYLEALQKATGVRLKVVPQAEEARLGFQTAVATVEAGGEVPDTMVVWDSGSGSFQMVRDSTVGDGGGGATADTYFGDFAVAYTTRLLVEQVQGRDFAGQPTSNPVTPADAEALITRLKAVIPRPIPAWPAEVPAVYAIGGTNSIFQLATDVVGKPTFTVDMVKSAVDRLVGQTDAELAVWCQRLNSDKASLVLPKLCLLYSVMTELKIQQVHMAKAVGCCAGIMRSSAYYATDKP